MSEHEKDSAGVNRRDMLRLLTAGGAAMAGGGWIGTASRAFAAPVPKKGGSIRVAYDTSSTADTLDPAKASSGSDYIRCFMFYSSLTHLDASLTPQMNLARSVETRDGRVWILKLRPGVTFHDGKPLAPADVVYSLMRHKDANTASKVKVLAEQFAEAKQTGPDEVTLTLDSANADLP